ncbi:metallopeptidase family protein [Kitasatospora kifunensis]|uniref:Putative Zn-dependent protease with MMP-like domain n=1 Tax=Kitasatospora kifunensis TaxID=58351 RepID=A0A7W7R4T3_KITKI|nr:metallopeptidase family protein [Kitasatospora kifunensis]MBB4925412.1 putative Zn-dependent protease with MMP-like domain [Kitasatospora kifunensis]
MDSSAPPPPASPPPAGSPPGPPPPTGSAPGPRRRDRHGRGLRGPLAPPQVPLSLSRSELFEDYVRESVERLERRWPQLIDVEFEVDEVPEALPGEPEAPVGAGVPLGMVVAARQGRKSRIVIYRRPVEIRAKSRDDRAALVHEILIEQVAELLGLSPDAIDPRYDED